MPRMLDPLMGDAPTRFPSLEQLGKMTLEEFREKYDAIMVEEWTFQKDALHIEEFHPSCQSCHHPIENPKGAVKMAGAFYHRSECFKTRWEQETQMREEVRKNINPSESFAYTSFDCVSVRRHFELIYKLSSS